MKNKINNHMAKILAVIFIVNIIFLFIGMAITYSTSILVPWIRDIEWFGVIWGYICGNVSLMVTLMLINSKDYYIEIVKSEKE